MKSFLIKIVVFLSVFFTTGTVFASENNMLATGGKSMLAAALAIASGLTIAIAAFGCAIAQSRAASAAFEGIARNPEASNKITIPLITALALIESLAIYALIIAFYLQGKI